MNLEKVSITRDVGTQSSTPANYLSSKSPSPARTPSIEERATKRCVADDSPMTTPELKSQEKVNPFSTSYYDVKDYASVAESEFLLSYTFMMQVY